ncbi:MAG TPA: Gfo/Idh/MocA family oxidoreductase [Opitutaceae bacterium]|jgi:predicted dehydrogenase
MPTIEAPLRVGVIGLGQWGPNHVRIFSRMTGCAVTRICDRSERSLAAARRQFPGIDASLDPGSITDADDIDAVVVATPVKYHHPLVKRALQNGKHVLCEKPLSGTARSSYELAALAARRRLTLMVGHIFLYNSGTLHLRDAITRGDLGRIYYMDAVRTNLGPVRTDVSVAFDLASHDISIFNFLLGARPAAVSAVGAAYLQRRVEDISFLTLWYPRGVVCHVHTSWLNPRKVRQLTVVGDRKMAVWDDMNTLEPVRTYDKGVVTNGYASFGEFHMKLRDGAITIPKIRPFEPLVRQNEEFAASIRSGRPPSASARFGADIVQILEAARRSMRSGGRTVSIRFK